MGRSFAERAPRPLIRCALLVVGLISGGEAVMPMVCPICSRTFPPQQLQCPECSTALHYQPDSGVPLEEQLPWHWSRTPWGRLLLGVVLSQGLYYGLYHFLVAGGLAFGYEDLYDLVALQALQMITVGAGSVLVGAGRRHGPFFGAVVGLLSGILYLVVQTVSGASLPLVSFYAQPIFHTFFGALGGLIGSWLWRPAPPPAPPPSSGPVTPPLSKPSLPQILVGQVNWGRVFVGVLIATGGFLWAGAFMEWAQDMTARPHGPYRQSAPPSEFQEWIMTQEVRALALFLGGCFAGACTWNGSLQGAWVGLLSTLVLVSRMVYLHRTPDLGTLCWTVAAVLGLAFVGGGWGGKLLPPLRKRSRRRRPTLV